jgi:hypothetical protein
MSTHNSDSARKRAVAPSTQPGKEHKHQTWKRDRGHG